MMNPVTAKFGRCAIVAVSALFALPTTAQAEAKGSVKVERIETRGTGTQREVVIHTSKKPTFSVFRLSEPFRVLVDVNDGRMEKPIDLMRVDDGMIRYVATNQFADETSAVLRVEVALDEPVPYSVRAKGTKIVVSVGTKGSKPAVVAKAKKPAKTHLPKPKAAPKEIASPEAVVLGKMSRRMRGTRTVLTAPVKAGSIKSVKIRTDELEDPRRMVVDLEGASIRPKWQRIRVQRLGIKLARIADKGDSVRIVLDVNRSAPLPKIEVDEVLGRLEVTMTAPAKPKAKIALAQAKPASKPVPAAQKAAPRKAVKRRARVAEKTAKPSAPKPKAIKPAPALVVDTPPAVAQAPAKPAPAASPSVAKIEPAAPGKAAAPSTQVKDVRFEPKDGFVRLTVVMDKKQMKVAKDSPAGAEIPVLRVAHTALPENLERTLDVSEVANGILSSISTYNDGGDLIIAANIDNGTEHRHWQKGNRVMWDFRNQTARTTLTAAAVDYPNKPSASFTAATSAVDTISKLAPRKQRYKGRRISLDLKDAEIQNVLRLLADVSKLNIVASDDVKGQVTIKLRNVPWDQALDIILRSKQLDKTRNGNIIRVAPIEVLRKEEELRLERAKAKVELEPLTVRLIPVSYAVANAVKPQVAALLSPRGKVNVDTRTNVLVVEDIAEVLLKAERLIRTLDTQTPQVLIESRIVEARSNFSRELGIQWGGNVNFSSATNNPTGLAFPNDVRIAGAADDQQANVTEGVVDNPNFAINLPAASVGSGAGGALGFVFGSLGGTALISLRLSAAEAMGRVKIISAPKVVTLDNTPASIVSGEKIPITVITANGPTTRFIDANLELKVVPHVTQDGSVLLGVSAKKNELSDRRDNLNVPGIITKEAETQMIVRDGDTAVMGGIYRRTASENTNYVPWLGQIPVLGWLFKRNTRSDARDELLIFISPRIVNRDAALVRAS